MYRFRKIMLLMLSALMIASLLPTKCTAEESVQWEWIYKPAGCGNKDFGNYLATNFSDDKKIGFDIMDTNGNVSVHISRSLEKIDLNVGLIKVNSEYINNKGKVVVPSIYYNIGDFHEGLVAVEKDDKWGYIDKNGKVVVPFIYDKVGDFNEGVAVVKKEDKLGCIDKSGKTVIPLIYSDSQNMYVRDGLVLILNNNNKYGFLDKSGKVVVPFIYDRANVFNEGLAPVEAYLDKSGKMADSNLDAGKLEYTGKTFKWGYIDKSGKVVIPYFYHYACPFNEGLAAVKNNEKWGYIDKNGKVVVPLIYDGVEDFNQGLAAVEKNDKWGYIDNRGKIVVPLIYDKVGDLYESEAHVSEGLVIVSNNKKWGCVNSSGKVVIPSIYDKLGHFHQGLAVIGKDEKWGVIDKNGKVIVPLIYDGIGNFSAEGLAAVTKNNKWGIINKTGIFIVPLMTSGELKNMVILCSTYSDGGGMINGCVRIKKVTNTTLKSTIITNSWLFKTNKLKVTYSISKSGAGNSGRYLINSISNLEILEGEGKDGKLNVASNFRVLSKSIDSSKQFATIRISFYLHENGSGSAIIHNIDVFMSIDKNGNAKFELKPLPKNIG